MNRYIVIGYSHFLPLSFKKRIRHFLQQIAKLGKKNEVYFLIQPNTIYFDLTDQEEQSFKNISEFHEADGQIQVLFSNTREEIISLYSLER